MPSHDLKTRARALSTRFEERFGRRPSSIAAAPGRVNLIGEHTDYTDGFVFPMAIERYTLAAAAPHPDASRHQLRVCSSVAEDGDGDGDGDSDGAVDRVEAIIPLDEAIEPVEAGHWSNYVRGVVEQFRRSGRVPPSADVLMESDVPLGSGLSSSAALEVATATMLEALTHAMSPEKKALACQRAEHEFAGVPCGIMDQFASVMAERGHLMLLDCRSLEVEQVPMTSESISVLVVNSNVRHELSGSEYSDRRDQCEEAANLLGVTALRDIDFGQLENRSRNLPDLLLHRARHVVSENERTLATRAALKSGDWPVVGKLLYASHNSLRNDFEVSCSELDKLVEIAADIGIAGGLYGSRMTGGGFGGCTVSLVRSDRIDEITSQIAERYDQATGIEPTIFVTRPARGAHVVPDF